MLSFQSPMCQVCEDDYYFDPDAIECLSCDRHDGVDRIFSSVTVLIFIGLIGFLVFAVLLYRIWQVYFLASADLRKKPELAKKLLRMSRALAAGSAKSKSLISFSQISSNVAFNCNIRCVS